MSKSKKLRFTPKDNSPVLGVGEHKCSIKQVFLATPKKSDLYTDKTEQIAVVFEDDNQRAITRWYNTKGFQLDADNPTHTDNQGRELPNYAVDSNGKRLEDPKKTEAAIRIIEQLGFDAGLREEFGLEDLEGKEIGIVVRRDDEFNVNKVAYTIPASQVKEASTSDTFA